MDARTRTRSLIPVHRRYHHRRPSAQYIITPRTCNCRHPTMKRCTAKIDHRPHAGWRVPGRSRQPARLLRLAVAFPTGKNSAVYGESSIQGRSGTMTLASTSHSAKGGDIGTTARPASGWCDLNHTRIIKRCTSWICSSFWWLVVAHERSVLFVRRDRAGNEIIVASNFRCRATTTAQR